VRDGFPFSTDIWVYRLLVTLLYRFLSASVSFDNLSICGLVETLDNIIALLEPFWFDLLQAGIAVYERLQPEVKTEKIAGGTKVLPVC